MSFNRYPEYKDSGTPWLGDVPAHWEVWALKRSLCLLTEKTGRRTNPVALENVEGWSGRFLPTTTEFEGDGVAFERGDILFGKLRPYLAKAYLADAAGEAVGDFHVMRPLGAVLPKFAQYQLLMREFIEVVDGSTFGSKMPRTSWEFLGSVKLASPPVKEQKQIVSFLDRESSKIDALIAEQQKLIALLKEKRQAAISHAVTKGLDPTVSMKESGVKWLGQVPADWDVASLKRFWSVTDCKHVTAEFVDEGFPLASIREVQSRFVTLDHAKKTTQQFYDELIEGDRKPLPGDLVFSRNATVGQVAQVADWHAPFAMGQDVCLLRRRSSEQSSDYLQMVIGSTCVTEQLEDLMIGSTFKRINVDEIRNLRIPVPPPAVQAAVSTFLGAELERQDGLIDEVHCAIRLLQERRTALISAAVTGKIDVRATVASTEAVA